MVTLTWCLFIACLLPYLAKIPVVIMMNKQPGGYDNKHPRTQQAALTGIGARAVAAHQNSFESLIIFSTAALTAIATHNTSCLIQGLAIFHLISRGIYHLLYLLNWATLRSTLWTLGSLSSLGILWLCFP